MYATLKQLAPAAEKARIRLVLEPLNSLCDHKGYFLDDSRTAFDLIKAVNSEFVSVLYDIYHMQTYNFSAL